LFVWRYWELHSGLCVYQASALPLEPYSLPVLLLFTLFFLIMSHILVPENLGPWSSYFCPPR
jgi:hypothetical protein